MERSLKKHFVLVHGSGHGAWCWYKLVTLLKLAGHNVTALDLGGCGLHTKRVEDIKLMSEYVQPVMDVLASLPCHEKVVLVGHSYGGLCISLAMENFSQKISVAVFITAYMPNCKDPPETLMQEVRRTSLRILIWNDCRSKQSNQMSLQETRARNWIDCLEEFFKVNSKESFMDCKFTFDQASEKAPISATFGPDFMAQKLYQHCEQQDLELAKMLVRPNGFFFEDTAMKSLLKEENYGSVRRVYIVCEDDRVMDEKFQKFLIDNSPPHEVRNISGAGHMVMLSKPKELCQSLQEIAETCH